MLQRLLSLFGFGYYLPTGSELGMSGSGAPETDGQAEVSFLAGKKTLLEAETEETLDERRKNLTDDSLVWPGKTDTMGFENPEAVDICVKLTVTDLEPGYYQRRPAMGGQWQQDGSVLLKPGEETTFEVVFVEPLHAEKATPRNFSYVFTRFDPRRANDPGQVLTDVPLRWVPLPTANDLRIAANPPQVIARPWRRAALFNLEFLNKSLLPPSVTLRILRGENKAKLDEEPEQVATISHPLPSRTPGVWKLLIPPPATRGSYYATIAGAARVADNRDYPLSLSRPVFVRYIPWLRMWKDWVFLLGSLFALLLIIWGVPVRKAPVVKLDVAISTPPGGDVKDVGIEAIPMNGSSESDARIRATRQDDGTYRMELPSRWYGYRPLFGWNTREPYTFRLRPVYLDKPAYADMPKSISSTGTFEAKLSETSFGGDWIVNIKGDRLAAPPKPGEPTITGYAPDPLSAGADATLTLSGQNFGAQTGSVTLDDKLLPSAKSWKETSIVVVIPKVALTPALHNITVKTASGAASGPAGITVMPVGTPPPPQSAPPLPDKKGGAGDKGSKGDKGARGDKGDKQGKGGPGGISTPPPPPPVDLKAKMLTEFEKFYTEDFNDVTNSSPPARSEAAYSAAQQYLAKAPQGDDLGNGLLAFLKFRRGENDYQDYLALANRHQNSLPASLATLAILRATSNFGGGRKESIHTLETLAEKAQDDLIPLRDCAYALAARWHSSNTPDDIDSLTKFVKGIRSEPLKNALQQ